jgi:hypothetical protein
MKAFSLLFLRGKAATGLLALHTPEVKMLYRATADVADWVPGVTVIANCGDVGGVMISEPVAAAELTVIEYEPVGVPVFGIGPWLRYL